MTKVFRYELRRVLLSRLFFGVLLACLGYGWLTLTAVTIRGAAHTAPFSPWSFGDYLSRLLPLLCLGELSFVGVFTSRRERRVQPITRASRVDPGRYALIRWGAVLALTLVLWLGVAALAVGFYAALFGWEDYGALAAPALLTMVPAAVFCLGAGWTLGRRSPALVYAAMGAALLLCWLPLPRELAFSPQDFFTQYPMGQEVLDPAFSVTGRFLLGRAAWTAAGIAPLLGRLLQRRGGLESC